MAPIAKFATPECSGAPMDGAGIVLEMHLARKALRGQGEGGALGEDAESRRVLQTQLDSVPTCFFESSHELNPLTYFTVSSPFSVLLFGRYKNSEKKLRIQAASCGGARGAAAPAVRGAAQTSRQPGHPTFSALPLPGTLQLP